MQHLQIWYQDRFYGLLSHKTKVTRGSKCLKIL